MKVTASAALLVFLVVPLNAQKDSAELTVRLASELRRWPVERFEGERFVFSGCKLVGAAESSPLQVGDGFAEAQVSLKEGTYILTLDPIPESRTLFGWFDAGVLDICLRRDGAIVNRARTPDEAARYKPCENPPL